MVEGSRGFHNTNFRAQDGPGTALALEAGIPGSQFRHGSEMKRIEQLAHYSSNHDPQELVAEVSLVPPGRVFL